jgi:hypothetical protein
MSDDKTAEELGKPRPLDEQAEFVMSFVDESDEKRQPFEEIWEEVELNFLVRPYQEQMLTSDTQYPLMFGSSRTSGRQLGRAILKDPETHQAIISIVSQIALSIAPESGFIHAKRVGFEDIFKAKTVNGLLEYAYRQEGHFWSMFEWILGAGIYGTGICEVFWDYIEEPRTLRSIDVDPFTGDENSTDTILTIPVWDDPRIEAFDIRDFFADIGKHQLHRMRGAARRFRIDTAEVMKRAESGIYEAEPSNEAVDRGISTDDMDDRRNYADPTALNPPVESHPEFRELIGFRYCGETPFTGTDDDYTRREIVVINGKTVRSKVWPRRLPWFECKITPRLGSFYGISPGELIRYDQDFADTLKMMLADAVVRMTHPPHIYDKNAEVELQKLRRFSPQVPIGANRVDAIQQVPYAPPINHAFAMYAGVKQQMREGSSATDPNQGLALGTKRLTASEALGTFERAGIRPEMFNRVMQQEYLPPQGKYILGLFQEMLEDTEDLAVRVGQSEAAVALADILADFDIEFVGSRIKGTQEQELQAFREIIAASANPAVFQFIPWVPLLRKHFDSLGAHEIAAMVGNPEVMQMNIVLTQIAAGGPSGTGARTPTAGVAQVGTLPAQLFGGPQAR